MHYPLLAGEYDVDALITAHCIIILHIVFRYSTRGIDLLDNYLE